LAQRELTLTRSRSFDHLRSAEARARSEDRAARERLAVNGRRMEAGASSPPHRHAGREECYVLEGELDVEGGASMRAGDYQVADEGSVHGVQSTRGGCTLLIVSSQDDELVA
jgi:anti-sigma factor ChrR (cupin superfamily)